MEQAFKETTAAPPNASPLQEAPHTGKDMIKTNGTARTAEQPPEETDNASRDKNSVVVNSQPLTAVSENTGSQNCELLPVQFPGEDADGIGKFKSVGELYKAYISLEQEFTRRSQILRELEKNAQCSMLNVKSQETTLSGCTVHPSVEGNHVGAAAPGQLSLRGAVSDAAIRESHISSGFDAPSNPSDDLQAASSLSQGVRKLDNCDRQQEIDSARPMSDDQLFEAARASEGVRNRIIEEYIGGIKAVLPVAMKGGMPAASVPYRPKTLAEAGNLTAMLMKMDKRN